MSYDDVFNQLEAFAGTLRDLRDLLKSNYGPKGGGQYDEKDNVNRKENRTGDRYENVGQNKAAHRWTTTGSAANNERVRQQAKDEHKKSKKTAVVWSEIHPDERKNHPNYIKASSDARSLIDSVPHKPKTK
jgi:hypothetical protein